MPIRTIYSYAKLFIFIIFFDISMVDKEFVRTEELKDVLERAVDLKSCGIMSYLSLGKWRIVDVLLTSVGQDSLEFFLSEEQSARIQAPRKDQPVGISIEHEFCKYVFEAVVIETEPSNDSNIGKIIYLVMPDSAEKMQRRLYVRVPVPCGVNVKTLFWHRGYNDEAKEAPDENYWQGRLLDLSAGGLRLDIDFCQESNFNVDQFIGLQFTPMSYEKPIVLEGQIKHIKTIDDGEKLCIGVEFLGLEATKEGRKKLLKLGDVVNVYQNENKMRKKERVLLS